MIPSIPKPNWDPFFQKKEVSAATEAGKLSETGLQLVHFPQFWSQIFQNPEFCLKFWMRTSEKTVVLQRFTHYHSRLRFRTTRARKIENKFLNFIEETCCEFCFESTWRLWIPVWGNFPSSDELLTSFFVFSWFVWLTYVYFYFLWSFGRLPSTFRTNVSLYNVHIDASQKMEL